MVFAGWPTEPGGDYWKGAGRRGENAARRENRDNRDPEREKQLPLYMGPKGRFYQRISIFNIQLVEY